VGVSQPPKKYKERILLIRNVLLDAKYGHLTVLNKDGYDKHKNELYRCRCDCGCDSVVRKGFLFKSDHIRCRNCSPTAVGLKNKKDLVGKEVNGWRVIREIDHSDGKYFYECECLNCGSISRKTTGAIMMSRSSKCKDCKPKYNFILEGDRANGTLPDGTQFIIDAAKIEMVNTRYWRIGKDGYLVSQNRQGKMQLLHRWVLGDGLAARSIVDHINRNRLDNRLANLRVITTQGNSCNHSLFVTNKTGYTGVYYSTIAQRYEAKVGYDGRRILLGTSKHDTVKLAQMYNIAAQHLFGEYVGHLNTVPLPEESLVEKIRHKCEKYKTLANMNRALSTEGAFAIQGVV